MTFSIKTTYLIETFNFYILIDLKKRGMFDFVRKRKRFESELSYRIEDPKANQFKDFRDQ